MAIYFFRPRIIFFIIKNGFNLFICPQNVFRVLYNILETNETF